MQRRALLTIAMFLFILAIFLRFTQLGQIPLGLNKDETAIGYNAYSILKTGRDEYGNYMPLYFKSFNDYKLPVYIYMTAASESIFGLTPFAVRFPSAISGILAIISLFFLVKILSNRLELAVLSSLFLAFNPWQFFFSRTGFEVNVATSFAILGSLLFIVGVKRKGNIFLLILSLFSFGLSLYSYNVARLVAPLLGGFLLLLYRKEIRKWSKASCIILAALALVIISPFLLTLRDSSGIQNQAGGVFLIGTYTKASQIELRSYLFNLPGVYTKLFFNTPLLIVWSYIRNLISSFSPEFFFINGAKYVNGVPNLGMFYPFEFLTIAIGMYMGIKRRESYLTFFFAWCILVTVLIALTVEVPHATRSFFIVVPLAVFSSYGFLHIWKSFSGIKNKFSKQALQFFAIVFGGYGLIYYFSIYFFMFPSNQAPTWRSEESKLIAFLNSHDSKYDRVIIDSETDISYTSIAFYKKLSPSIYRKEVQYKKDGLLESASKLGKYEFKNIKWNEYSSSIKTLYITTAGESGSKPIYKTFYYPERPVVITPNGIIATYPYKNVAYVLVEN